MPWNPTNQPTKSGSEVWFGLVSLFNAISTFVGYLMPEPSFHMNSGTI